MSDYGPPPVIPEALRQYNSYEEDPKWQRRFTAVWAAAAGLAILLSLPHLIRSIKTRRAFAGLFGVSEDLSGKCYVPVTSQENPPQSRRRSRLVAWGESISATYWWALPGVELSFGQMVLIAGYLAVLVVCITMDSQLMTNPNRAGFLAIAQLPLVFLFATKNSVLSLLLGPGNGYEKLNYIHRWSGRGMFIGATVHGSLWIRNHLQYGFPILGQQKETSGVACFALLCVIVLTSMRPVRRLFYQAFWIIHILTFVAFFITIRYHTLYAAPWIFPPLAFYGLDFLMRLFKYRIKDASLVSIDQNMTLIHVHDCDNGWTAGQHVRLRVFFSGRVLESHPLTILNASPATSCLTATSGTGTLMLAARVHGDWTRALNAYARDERTRLSTEKEEKEDNKTPVPVNVMLDGPYGGCSLDVGSYESALLVAGGSGVAFTIGVLDDIVARCVKLGRRNGERARRIEFVWCIRSFAQIDWFTPMLMDIANTAATSETIDLHISIFVTCLCNPEAVPPIPNCDVTIFRPSVTALLRELITPPSSSAPSQSSPSTPPPHPSSSSLSIGDVENEADYLRSMRSKLPWTGLGGGVAVCASGPERLIREARNAVAKVGATRGGELGGVGLHTELFSL